MEEFISDIEAEELLNQIIEHEKTIQEAQEKRDNFIAHYQSKIAEAMRICDAETKDAEIAINILTEQLRQYAEINLPKNRKSVKLPSGTLSFGKQSPRFFFDDLKEANAQNERLIKFVKHNAYQFLKVKTEESVDWQGFKSKLIVDDDGTNVYYAETGEIIDGLRAQILPDKFVVKTK